MANWSDDDPEREIPFALSEKDRKFLLPRLARAILARIGRENAIKSKQLEEELQVTNRKIRLGVRELVRLGHAIASTVAPPYGYYVVAKHEEAREFEANLASRAKEDFAHLTDFQKAVAAKLGPTYQLGLFGMDDGSKEIEHKRERIQHANTNGR